MDNQYQDPVASRQGRLLATLEGLLVIQATETRAALNQAAQLLAEVLGADKVDVFLYEPAVDTLIAFGTSDTPMGRRQVALGLNRLPLSNGGNGAAVFQTGEPYHSGHVDQDPNELRGIKEGLGIRSAICVPLELDGTRRGVLQIDAAQPDHFPVEDVAFLQAAAGWIALVLHRAELVERIAETAAEEARRKTAHELITTLAHDLRAPLTPIRGYLGMLRQVAVRDGQHGYLRFVEGAQRGVVRLEEMLRDLLDASRLERDLFDLAIEPVDLAALVHETAVTLQTPTTPIEVRTPDEVVAEVDPARLRQALENLLGNALRHSPEGVPVIVELRVEAGERHERAAITVRDAGPGIAPELLSRLFTQFSSDGNSDGLGLGLYLARGIAAAHDGTLTVDSTPGQGASFRLALPLRTVGPR